MHWIRTKQYICVHSMLIQTHHFSFPLDKSPSETETQFRLIGSKLTDVLNQHPEYIHHLDEVIENVRRYIMFTHADCVSDKGYTWLEDDSSCKT